jgi:hypothetical protein
MIQERFGIMPSLSGRRDRWLHGLPYRPMAAVLLERDGHGHHHGCGKWKAPMSSSLF